MMIPIVWPKGSFWRQFLVFVCFIILVSGRVVNLFVPEYTKRIGKEILNTTAKASRTLCGNYFLSLLGFELLLYFLV